MALLRRAATIWAERAIYAVSSYIRGSLRRPPARIPSPLRKMLSVELIIVVVLIVINGLLSMSELAVVSSRPARLSQEPGT